MSALTGSINFLFILLGVAIGVALGVGGERLRIKIHHTRKALLMARPLITLAGYTLGALVVFLGAGALYLGVI